MWELALGIAAAVGASTLYSLGVAVQAMDARETPEDENLRWALAMRLVRSTRWLFGTGLTILGFPLQVVALLLAPLVVVQPALAAGLIVLLVISEHLLDERPGRMEYIAVCAIVIGVLGAALCAPPRSTTHTSEDSTLTIVLVCLGVAGLLPYLLAMVRIRSPEITMLGAGLAFAWSGVATKLASDDLSNGHTQVALAWAASTAVASGVATLSEMSALQSRPAIQVAPVVFVTQTVVPVVLAPLLLGESFSGTPLGGVPLALSLALLVAGATLLARSPLLLALTASADRVSEESGSTPSRSEASHETIRSSPRSDVGEPDSSTTITSPPRIVR
jgi:drug/metabolite transporter (DMT)-like permease